MKPNLSMTVPFRLLVLLLLGAIVIPFSLRAEKVGFPKDKPAFTVEVPSGWKATDSGSSITLQDPSAKAGSGQIIIREVDKDAKITDEASAKAALCDLAKGVMSFKDAKCSEPAEMTVAGHTAYSTIVTGKLFDAPATQQIVVFTPDGSTWFRGSSMVNDAGATDFGIQPALSAIKSAGGGD